MHPLIHTQESLSHTHSPRISFNAPSNTSFFLSCYPLHNRPQSVSATRSSMSRIPAPAIATTANRPGSILISTYLAYLATYLATYLPNIPLYRHRSFWSSTHIRKLFLYCCHQPSDLTCCVLSPVFIGWSATSSRVRRPLSASFAWGRGRGIGGKPNPVWGKPPSPIVTRGDVSGVAPGIVGSRSTSKVGVVGNEEEKEESMGIGEDYGIEMAVTPLSIAAPPLLPCSPATLVVVSTTSYPTTTPATTSTTTTSTTSTSTTSTATSSSSTILPRRAWSPPQNRPTILSSPAPAPAPAPVPTSTFSQGSRRSSSPSPSSSSSIQHRENNDFRHFAESRTSWGVITRLGEGHFIRTKEPSNDKKGIGGIGIGISEGPSSIARSSSTPPTKSTRTTTRSRSQPRLCSSSSPVLTGVAELKAKAACDKVCVNQ